METKINLMSIDDLNFLEENLTTEFDDFWNFNILKNEFENPNSNILVLKDSNNFILGFACFSIILDEAEITNIVIRKSFRGKKLSNILMSSIIDLCKKKKLSHINLEVCIENITAISLYKKFGFIQNGLRKNYYNGKDAILMQKIIDI